MHSPPPKCFIDALPADHLLGVAGGEHFVSILSSPAKLINLLPNFWRYITSFLFDSTRAAKRLKISLSWQDLVKNIKTTKRCHFGSVSKYWPAVYLAELTRTAAGLN